MKAKRIKSPKRAEKQSKDRGTLVSRKAHDERVLEQLSEEEMEGFGMAGVGFATPKRLNAAEEKRFHAFQENFLSLISHELRTPLTGILNSLGVLEAQLSEGSDDMPVEELVSMARRNAQRLHDTLAQLLDLAEMESSVLKVRLRETELSRLVRLRSESNEALLREKAVELKITESERAVQPILADAEKLGRAFDLIFQMLIKNVAPSSSLLIDLSPTQATFDFSLEADQCQAWDQAWSEALVGFESRVVSPVSAFAETLQTQEEFLTRTKEGLHSELLIVFEILRRHSGKFWQSREGNQVRLEVEFPPLSNMFGLQTAIQSRVYEASTGLSTVALALIQVPEDLNVADFQKLLRKIVFRASDGVYGLENDDCVALVMDDCKADDAPKLLSRIAQQLKRDLVYGVVTCPEEGTDPGLLIKTAEQRLEQSRGQKTKKRSA